MALFTSFIFDKAVRSMGERVDQHIIIYDIDGAGWSNFQLSHLKAIAPIVNVISNLIFRITTQRDSTRLSLSTATLLCA